MPADLSGAFAKYRRGNKHFYALRDEVATWIKTRDHHWTLEPDPKKPDGTRFQERLTITRPPAFEQWAVLIGDTVHNYRAALDHALYALAIWYERTDPPRDERTLQFPICDGPERWKQGRWRISNLPLSVQAAINCAQPYKGARDGFVRPLAALRELDDADKHRLLHLAVQVPSRLTVTFDKPPLRGDVHMIQNVSPLEDQAIAVKFYFSEPQDQVGMNFEISLTAALEMPIGYQPYGGVTLMLASIKVEVRRVLGILQQFGY